MARVQTLLVDRNASVQLDLPWVLLETSVLVSFMKNRILALLHEARQSFVKVFAEKSQFLYI
jgi:hypothetical protein